MESNIKNWLTQIKKGYLDLCILTLIGAEGKAYGFQLITKLEELDIAIKEGTLYPLLNRMTKEGVLVARWETKEIKGHPRKFYSLTRNGKKSLESMQAEYQSMYEIFEKILKTKEKTREKTGKKTGEKNGK